MRKSMGIVACLFAFAVPAVAVQIGAARDSETTHLRTLAGPPAPPPTEATTVPEPPTTLAPEPEPAPVLCPGAPHPEQACLGPSHNHEATSSSAGTRQAARESGGEMGSTWECIAHFESDGNYAERGNPSYRGKYQLGYQEWADMGGSGDPADAPPAEQDMRAQRLQSERGWAPWSTHSMCGV